MPLRSYANTLSYRPGDPISVHVDGHPQDVAISLKRLVHSQDASTDIDIPWDANGTYSLRKQDTCVGGFATGEVTIDSADQLTFGAFFWLATTELPGPHTFVSLEGDTGSVRLEHEAGQLTVRLIGTDASSSHVLPGPVRFGVWYFAAVTFESGHLTVHLVSTDLLRGESHVGDVRGFEALGSLDLTHLTVAAHHPQNVTTDAGLCRGRAEDFFTGKIEGPFVASSGISTADVDKLASGETDLETVFGGSLRTAWDFSPYSAGEDPNLVLDLVTGKTAKLVNLPTQAVTGRFFDGSVVDYRFAPAHYAAVHFHNTDLADAGWEALVQGVIPEGLDSGIYAIQLDGTDETDLLPIYVVPSLGAHV